MEFFPWENGILNVAEGRLRENCETSYVTQSPFGDFAGVSILSHDGVRGNMCVCVCARGQGRVAVKHAVSYDFRLAPAITATTVLAASMNVCMRYQLYALCIERDGDKKSRVRPMRRHIAHYREPPLERKATFLSFTWIDTFHWLIASRLICILVETASYKYNVLHDE